jgi:tetratricopeptide (TPR) repeat protein
MTDAPMPAPAKKRARHPVGPRLKILLYVIFGLFALLGINAVYLVAIRALEYQTGQTYQNFFYLGMFLGHLIVGVLLVVPALVFAGIHIRNTYQRANRRAVRAGFALFAAVLILLVSGIVLTRIEGLIEVNDPTVRGIAFWAHVLSPLFVIWLYILHRLAGRRIRWRVGLAWAVATGVAALILVVLQNQDPRAWNTVGPEKGVQYFFPSLARTSTGNFISNKVLHNDKYCLECHTEAHQSWASSAHRFSSFSNPAYLLSIKNTRQQMMERDGNVQGARFCAGCHDPVPFFTGAFDDPKFDDPDYDLAADPQAQAGITCTVCHAISNINSPKGNSDYTIDEPIHYPFAFSDNEALRWVNRQLVKAKPRFHKQTFLKPLHKTTEFCGTCHKVHLPEELNHYRWLRGQNHYDSFWLSGVSGHSVSSFYYPPVAEENCNDCHMPQLPVEHNSDTPNFAAAFRKDKSGHTNTKLTTFDHMFPGANTAVPHMLRDTMPDPDRSIEAHTQFLKDCMRVDIFGIREEGRIDGELQTVGPTLPTLERGKTYLVEVVIRTLKLGHHFTQGTADSNEVWLDVKAANGQQLIGRSGGRRETDNGVDPWSHFVNAFVIDRNGDRINRRNAEDIFVALYNHQIPPGATDVVHYKLTVPADAGDSITFEAALQYRKFDSEYLQLIVNDGLYGTHEPGEPFFNDLPIVTMCKQAITFPVASDESSAEESSSPQAYESSIPAWQRWNDYGIGLLRSGQLRQAERAFQEVERFGKADGPLNLARVYLAEGRVTTEAPAALKRAREVGGGAAEWSILWFSGLVNKQLGEIEAAATNFEQIVEGGFAQATGRKFNFANDYRLLNELADTMYLLGLRERGEKRKATRLSKMMQAEEYYLRTLRLDPENADAHYGIRRVYEELGESDKAKHHDEQHQKYKLNDNARDAAIAHARKQYPAANHAAERVVIHDLGRAGAFDSK